MEVVIITVPTLLVRFNVLAIQRTSYRWTEKLVDVSETSFDFFLILNLV